MSLQTLSRARADALLLLVALIWGAAFVAQKSGAEHIGPLSFLALRFSLAALVLLPLALLESRKAGVPLTPHDRRGMLRICLCLCSASILQQFAMVHTSAGNAGTLTKRRRMVPRCRRPRGKRWRNLRQARSAAAQPDARIHGRR